jgi:pimeloyl-ACP methyl ester carboxylesterase
VTSYDKVPARFKEQFSLILGLPSSCTFRDDDPARFGNVATMNCDLTAANLCRPNSSFTTGKSGVFELVGSTAKGLRTMTTDWTFGGLWPFEPRWFETSDGRMHYVDEGPWDGRPVVLVHGNPTWGFLYRNFIGPLTEAGHRAIVPDHLGFGRSDKPTDPELYRIPRHVTRLEALLESLDLGDAVVVVQDWGGPIGLSWAVAHPERVSGLFILDTFAGPRQNLPVPLRLFRAPGVGEVLVKGLDMFVRGFLFRDGVVHRERLTEDVRRAYLAPHPTWSSRTGELVFPREIPDPASATGTVAELLTRLERGVEQYFRSKPARIIWAMRDPAFTPAVLEQWRMTLPDAPVTKLDDASHYLQEDAHERIVPQLVSFLAGSAGR